MGLVRGRAGEGTAGLSGQVNTRQINAHERAKQMQSRISRAQDSAKCHVMDPGLVRGRAVKDTAAGLSAEWTMSRAGKHRTKPASIDAGEWVRGWAGKRIAGLSAQWAGHVSAKHITGWQNYGQIR